MSSERSVICCHESHQYAIWEMRVRSSLAGRSFFVQLIGSIEVTCCSISFQESMSEKWECIHHSVWIGWLISEECCSVLLTWGQWDRAAAFGPCGQSFQHYGKGHWVGHLKSSGRMRGFCCWGAGQFSGADLLLLPHVTGLPICTSCSST